MRQTSPILSVCLITYNHGKYIRKALDGIFSQKVNFPMEVIIADDCSTDNTREIILEYYEKYSSIIHLIFQDKNIGPAENWYQLMKSPAGKYIAYFEGDDYWTDPLKLQKQIDFLEQNPSYAISFHDVREIDLDGTTIRKLPIQKLKEDLTLYDLVSTNFIPTVSAVFRNYVTDYDFIMQAPIGDYLLHISNAMHGPIRYHKEIMAAYRTNSGVFSSIKKYKQREKIVRTLNIVLKKIVLEKLIVNKIEHQRNNLLFLIFKEKKKENFSKEIKAMLFGNEQYDDLSFQLRMKFLLKSFFVN